MIKKILLIIKDNSINFMLAIDTFNTRKILEINSQKYTFYDLNALESVFELDLWILQRS